MKIDSLLESLEGWRATGVSALFLAGSLAGVLGGYDALVPLAWVPLLISGTPLAAEGVGSLLRGRITSALLVTVAMVASVLIGEVFAAGEIAFIMALGELLEDSTVARARKGLEQLLALNPAQGRLLHADGSEEMVSAESIRRGDLLRVKPGETIPADGAVEAGATSVNQSILTGESLPVDRAAGDEVFAGTLNGEGCIDIRASRDAGDSSLQRLIALVKEAGERKAPIAREADRWASWLVPASIGIAIAGYVALRMLGYEASEAQLRAVTVLVVFCPCALVLATPTSIVAAIGQATKRGVIIKSGEALELLGRVTHIAFDKTGTLTLGKPEVRRVDAFGAGREELLRLAAAGEARSEHPLARAILAAAGGDAPEVSDFQALPGRGVAATLDGSPLLCGSEACMEEAGVTLTEPLREALKAQREEGLATILVARDGVCLGAIGLGDTLRPETPKVLEGLKGLHRAMLTGDHAAAARHLAQGLPLDSVHAELLPHEKVAVVRGLQEQGATVSMVGDGVNDAPALKQAHVGISMSRLGSDIATEAADISLMNDDLRRLPYLLRLAKATLRTIRGNIAASLVINAVAVVLSLMGVLTPITGALVHNAGSVLVVLNAALLFDRRFD